MFCLKNDLLRLLDQNNPDLLVEYVDNLNPKKFSLVTLVDALSPMLVMESNLTFGSFHLIKMSLFLRSMSLRGLLSKETEIALAKVIVQHLYYLEWSLLDISPHVHAPDPINKPISHMLTEIEQGNAHNAFFYASIALQSDKACLLDTLLLNGAKSIPDSLGHSISCFFPVLEDLVDVDHPATGTALFSYILYLCRHRAKNQPNNQATQDGRPNADQKADQKADNINRSTLLRQAASGTSIFDIHHMITFYIFLAWEKAAWHNNATLPWAMLKDWIGQKKIDQSRLDSASVPGTVDASGKIDTTGTVDIPANYHQWHQIFSEKNTERIASVALAVLAHDWQQASDWIMRSYADYYTPDWDPHYITSLYAALELYQNDAVNKTDSQMAIIQALTYFVENV